MDHIICKKIKLLECDREDLQIRRERIQLIYEEARAQDILLRKSVAASPPLEEKQQHVLVPATPSSSSYSGNDNSDTVVPATDYSDDDNDDAKEEEDIVTVEAGIPSQMCYNTLLRITSPYGEDFARICCGKKAALEMELSSSHEEMMLAKCRFLAVCEIPTKVAHLDSFCMPGFKKQLQLLRIPGYESHMEGRLNYYNCCSPLLSSSSSSSSSMGSSFKDWVRGQRACRQASKARERIEHYCMLVLLSLTRKHLPPEEGELALFFANEVCHQQKEVHWYDLDEKHFGLFCTAPESMMQSLRKKREAVLLQSENDICAAQEAKLEEELQRWSFRASQEGEKGTKHDRHAKKKLLRVKWEIKVHVASTLCIIAKRMLASSSTTAAQ